jgi:hypothetical protein
MVGGGFLTYVDDGMAMHHGNEQYLEEYNWWLTKNLKIIHMS